MDKIHWHPGFQGATEWELKANKKDLTFDEVKPIIEKAFGFKFDGPKDDPMTVTEEELNLLLKGFEKDKKDFFGILTKW